MLVNSLPLRTIVELTLRITKNDPSGLNLKNRNVEV